MEQHECNVVVLKIFTLSANSNNTCLSKKYHNDQHQNKDAQEAQSFLRNKAEGLFLKSVLL